MFLNKSVYFQKNKAIHAKKIDNRCEQNASYLVLCDIWVIVKVLYVNIYIHIFWKSTFISKAKNGTYDNIYD